MIDFICLNLLILALCMFERLMSGRISRRLQYALWLSVPVYLFTCIMNFNVLLKVVMSVSPRLAHNLVRLEVNAIHIVNSIAAMLIDLLTAKGIGVKVNIFVIFKMMRYGVTVVLAGSFLLYNAVFAVRCVGRRRFYKQDAQTGMKIYLLDYPQTPFLFVRSIYVHPDMTQNEELLRHAVCHEYSHYKQGDFLWPLLRCLFLIYYWFDPIVWLAAARIRQDGELACDEHVISILGEDSRAAYGGSLITLMKANGNKRRLDVAANMGGRKKQLRERVEAIAGNKKRGMFVTGIVITGIVMMACCVWIGVVKNANQKTVEPAFIWDGTRVEKEEIKKVTLYRFVDEVTYPTVDITEEVLAGRAVSLAMPGRYMVIVTTRDNQRVEISDCSTDETAYSEGLLPSRVVNIGGDNR